MPPYRRIFFFHVIESAGVQSSQLALVSKNSPQRDQESLSVSQLPQPSTGGGISIGTTLSTIAPDRTLHRQIGTIAGQVVCESTPQQQGVQNATRHVQLPCQPCTPTPDLKETLLDPDIHALWDTIRQTDEPDIEFTTTVGSSDSAKLLYFIHPNFLSASLSSVQSKHVSRENAIFTSVDTLIAQGTFSEPTQLSKFIVPCFLVPKHDACSSRLILDCR